MLGSPARGNLAAQQVPPRPGQQFGREQLRVVAEDGFRSSDAVGCLPIGTLSIDNGMGPTLRQRAGTRRRMMPVKLLSEQYCSQIRNQPQLEVLVQYRRTVWAVIGD
jgi:hypothetical protein